MRTLAALLLAAGTAAAHDWNGIAIDADGNVFVVEAEYGRIWKIARDGTSALFVSAKDGEQLGHPHHLAIDAKGTLWLASG
jgi:sugar lactone lactonase YvrE